MNISVIIPTYNRKKYLKKALKSVLEQTYLPGEIIVVDDGSTDGTETWLKKKYPLVTLVQQPNRGVSAARNAGIEKSKGDWIALLDSDDEWLPHKLEEQVKELERNISYNFCHTNEIWIRNGKRVNQRKKHQKYGGLIFDKCLDMCRISPSSVLIKKSIFNAVGLFDTSLPICEDFDLWLRITAKHPVLFLDKPLLVKYGGHGDQLSRAKEGIEQFRIQSLEKLIDDPGLNPCHKNDVLQMLIKKLDIYANGAEKRGKISEATSAVIKLELYQKLFHKLEGELA